jgi:hypothetical protein
MAKTVSSVRTPDTVWPCNTSIRIVVLRCASEVSTCQRWWDQLGEVGHTVNLCVEERRHQGDLAGPEPTRADVVAHRAEPSGIWQGRQCLSGEPRGTSLRFQPRHQLVVEAERCAPAGPWEAFDRRCPPHPRPDQGPAEGDIHDLARADAEHRRHAGLDEEGEMGLGAEAPIGHEHVPFLSAGMDRLHPGQIVGEKGRDDPRQDHPSARMEQP